MWVCRCAPIWCTAAETLPQYLPICTLTLDLRVFLTSITLLRFCREGQDERNYHVFYHLLIGSPASSAKTALGLNNRCEYYHYLNQSGCTTCATIDEEDRWSELQVGV